MGTLGPAELLVILLVALLVLGPERLPDAARKVGQFMGEVRKIGSGFQAEFRDAMKVDANPAATAPSVSSATGGPASEHGLVSDAAGPAAVSPPGPGAGVEVAPPPPARPDVPTDQLP